VSKSNNIAIPVTNGQDVSLLHDTSDDIETYPKQVKHDDFPSFSDRFITQTSTPIGKDDLNVSDVTATIDPVVGSLQQEIKNLREIIISLQDKVNKKCDPVHQQTQLSVQYVDSSSQTEDIKTVSRHTEASSMSVKSISTQIYKNIEKNSVSSHCQTEKGKATNIPKPNSVSSQNENGKATNVPKPKDHNTKTLIIGSSILNGIKTRRLIHTDVCTNRGADINTLINIIERRDLSVYKTIIVHIGGNDLNNGYSLDTIYENYQSLLYLLRAQSNMETVLMVSGIPPRYGTNVQPLNMILDDLCDNLQFIDHTKVFNDRPHQGI
jgi:hypothetical protein